MHWLVSLVVLSAALVAESAPGDGSTPTTIDPTTNVPEIETTTQDVVEEETEITTEVDLDTTTDSNILPKVSYLDDVCNNETTCRGDHIICNPEGICACEQSYFHSTNNQCLKLVEAYGDPCSTDEQCEQIPNSQGNMRCINYKCICEFGMTLIDNVCKPKPMLGTPCETSAECKVIDWSVCHENKCTCQNGYIRGNLNNSCLPLAINRFQAIHGESASCKEDSQCQNILGDMSICDTETGRCTCHPGNHRVRDKCVPYKKLGESCDRDEECISRHVTVESESSRYCNKTVCTCSFGWKQNGDDNCLSSSAMFVPSGALLLAALALTRWSFY